MQVWIVTTRHYIEGPSGSELGYVSVKVFASKEAAEAFIAHEPANVWNETDEPEQVDILN